MRFNTLNQWLDWQQQLHWQEIDLGLERASQVADKLQLTDLADVVITVAGTNGKGSTAAYYSALLLAQGFSVGCYSSPHLLTYNERIMINGQMADDQTIMQAFDAIDQARGSISLSYFEFSTLAALYCFKQAKVDVAVLEVGLGGRLDAVNMIDADLLHFTPIGIDHTAWLGETRELIAAEKAGVLRQGCLAVCNDPNPPQSLRINIEQQAKRALYIKQDYMEENGVYRMGEDTIDLSHLALLGEHQKQNCAGVLAGLSLLDRLALKQPDIDAVLSSIQLKGRFETVFSNDNMQIIVDVAHNVEAAKTLNQQLSLMPKHRCVLILGMLSDKTVDDFCAELSQSVVHCICMDLDSERGLSAQQLKERIADQDLTTSQAPNMTQALQQAKTFIDANQHEAVCSDATRDIILVTGSFYTVEAYFNSTAESSLWNLN